MAKIAIDVVLLPSEELTDKAIELNKKLLETFEKKIVLRKDSCLPHISLCMGVVDENDLPAVEEILQDIAKRFSSLSLNAVAMPPHTIPTGKKVSGLVLEKTEELQSLHETVMKKLDPYLTHDVTTDLLCAPPEIEEVSLYWIKIYAKEKSFKNYAPHITIGFGETDEVDLPISFSASTLALCHLGNYCTCRKVLYSTKLKK